MHAAVQALLLTDPTASLTSASCTLLTKAKAWGSTLPMHPADAATLSSVMNSITFCSICHRLVLELAFQADVTAGF
jgi:hypothetical protein